MNERSITKVCLINCQSLLTLWLHESQFVGEMTVELRPLTTYGIAYFVNWRLFMTKVPAALSCTVNEFLLRKASNRRWNGKVKNSLVWAKENLHSDYFQSRLNFRPRPRSIPVRPRPRSWPHAMLASFSRRLSSWPCCQSSKPHHLRCVLLR